MDEIRTACREAVERIGALDDRQLVLLGSSKPASASAWHDPLAPGRLDAYGVAVGGSRRAGEVDLPLSLSVGAWLVTDVLGPGRIGLGCSVGRDFASSQAAVELLALARSHSVGLIVMGDASARRSERAPGYLDSRSQAFDLGVLAALQSGDGAALSALDPRLGEELLAAGVPAWRAAGALLEGSRYDSQVAYAGDPFGVGYFVAHWTCR